MIKYRIPMRQRNMGILFEILIFDFPIPIHIKEGGVTSFERPGRDGWLFWTDQEEIVCQITPLRINGPYIKTEYIMIYRTDQLLNPVPASAIPMLIADRRLSLLSRDRHGKHLYSLSIEYDKDRVIWSAYEEQQSPISFSALKNRVALPAEVATSLHTDQDTLMERIRRAVDLRPAINDLFIDYLTLIDSLQDYSITGWLDKDLSSTQKYQNSGFKTWKETCLAE